MANFDQAIIKTLKWEGGETTDTGGYTKYGISQKAYPNLDIKNMSLAEAKAIYKRDYWDRVKGDQINNQDLAALIFDYAVNAGTGQAAKDLQRVLNVTGAGLEIDGAIGPKTLAAINKANAPVITQALSLRRIKFYEDLSNKNPAIYAKYLIGWVKRANDFMPENLKSPLGLTIVSILFAGAIFYKIKA